MKKGRDLLRHFHSTNSTFSSSSAAAATSVTNQATSPSPAPPPIHKLGMEDASQRYCYNPTLNWNPEVEDYFVNAYGADHFSRISKALTQPSCYSCVRVNTLRSTTDAVIEKLLKILQESKLKSDVHYPCMSKIGDDNFSVSEKLETTANGAVSNGGSCGKADFDITEGVDPLIASVQTSLISKCQIPGLDYVLFVKGSGPHPIEYGYHQEKPPKEVIISRKCAEAVLRGAQVYVPGVLACSGHVEEGDVVAVSVAIEQPGSGGGWGVGITRGTILEGLQTDPQYFERSGLYIGQGTTVLSRAGIFRVLSGLAVDMNDRVYSLPSFNDVLEGEIFLQNLPSIITAHVLDPQPGERVLDMCAAPGGKTTAIVTLMKDKGEVIAVDRSHNKVAEIQKLAAELGMNSITTYKLDALKSVRTIESKDTKVACLGEDIVHPSTQASEIPEFQMENKSCSTVDLSETIKNASDEQAKGGRYASRSEERKKTRRLKNGPGRNHCVGGRVEKCEGFYPNSFDKVLLDAPCSALGLRPRLFAGEETVESMRKHSKYQRRMFDQAVQLVRPGGFIVYSTCTINPGENEGLVRYALDTYKFLSLASQHPRVGGPGLVGRCESSDGYIEEWLRPGEEDLVQRFDPSSPLDTIGFFIAKFTVGPKDA